MKALTYHGPRRVRLEEAAPPCLREPTDAWEREAAEALSKMLPSAGTDGALSSGQCDVAIRLARIMLGRQPADYAAADRPLARVMQSLERAARPEGDPPRDTPETGPADDVKRIIFCSGKVYYDLLNYRTQRKIENAAIIRIEQLYPLAEKKLREMLKPFPKNAKFVWCQEEPENMGAWTFIEPRLRTLFCTEISYVGREASASPAVGALARHKREQTRLVAEAFSI